MRVAEIVWYCVVCAFVSVAVVAIVFAILAWNDSQSRRPHRPLVRSDIQARGDFFADGDVRTKSDLRVDGDAQIRGKARIASIALDQVQTVTTAEPVLLSRCRTAYRIDTTGTQTIPILLPAIADAPLQLFFVSVSRQGSENTVQITADSAAGDVLQAGTGISNTYTLPYAPGQPDAVLLMNDGLSTWFLFAHT
jgi:hypothetical protein